MKKLKKSTAIVLSVLLMCVLVIGLVLSFAKITVGANTFVSFSGAINVSSDIAGGMYGEYKIKTENASKSAIVSSMQKIKEVFEEDGYKNVKVYSVGNSKIRVEVSYPRGSKTFANTYSELSNVCSGAFALRSTYSASDDASSASVDGATCVSEIKVFSNNGTKYISIIFNEKGQEQYRKLCQSTTTIYLALGEYAQSISASNVTDYTQFTLSDSDYSNLIDLEQRVKLGCMQVEVDADTAVINTMSASLTAGESTSSPELAGFESSTALVVIASALFIMIAVGIAVFAVKFGLFSLLILYTLGLNTFLALMIMNLIPSIEIGLSSFVAIILGMTMIYLFAFMYASRVKFEYNQGKSLAASLQTAYKKLLPINLIENIAMLIFSVVFYVCAFGELSSFSIIFAILSFLSLFTNLLLIPFLVKICISYGPNSQRLFMLKKRDNLLMETTVSDAGTSEVE